MPNWFNKQLPKSRYTFSVEGDVFIDEEENKELEKNNAEDILIGKLPSGDGIRVNNYNVIPYRSI